MSSCSDDGDDNNPPTTPEDAGSDAGSGSDAGTDAQVAADAGDAAIDAGDAATDAGSDAGDAATDAGKPDSGDELAQALVTTGVRTDRRRAELVAPPFCTTFISCSATNPPTPAECEGAVLDSYDQLVGASDTPNCIDAHLDFFACIAAGGTCSELEERCATISAERDTRCDQK